MHGEGAQGSCLAPGEAAPQSAPVRGQRWMNHLAVAVYLLLAVSFLGYYNASDDGGYLKWVRAFHYPDSAFQVALDQRATRLTLWLPPALASRLGAPVFGSAVAWVFFLGAAVVAMVSYAGGRAFSPAVRAGAALLVACTPTFLIFSTSFFPDVPLLAFLLAAFLLYRGAPDASLSRKRGLLIGILIGLATIAKQSGMLLFLVISAHQTILAIRRRELSSRLRALAHVCLGGALVVAFTLGFFWWLEGRPFLFFEITGNIHTLFVKNPAYQANVHSPLVYLDHLRSPHYARLGPVLLAGTVLALFLCRAARLEAIFALAYLAYLQFGSTSLSHYVPPSRHARYLIPALPFMAISCASLAESGWHRLRARARRRPGAGRLIAAAGIALPALLFAGMALVALEWGRPILPLNDQLRFFREALREGNGPLLVSRETVGRWVAVLSEEEYRGLRVLERGEPLPERYSLLLHVSDVRYHTATGDSAAAALRGPFSFTAAETSWRPVLPRGLARRLRIERRAAASLFRIDVGPEIRTRPSEKLPAWLARSAARP